MYTFLKHSKTLILGPVFEVLFGGEGVHWTSGRVDLLPLFLELGEVTSFDLRESFLEYLRNVGVLSDCLFNNQSLLFWNIFPDKIFRGVLITMRNYSN